MSVIACLTPQVAPSAASGATKAGSGAAKVGAGAQFEAVFGQTMTARRQPLARPDSRVPGSRLPGSSATHNANPDASGDGRLAEPGVTGPGVTGPGAEGPGAVGTQAAMPAVVAGTTAVTSVVPGELNAVPAGDAPVSGAATPGAGLDLVSLGAGAETPDAGPGASAGVPAQLATGDLASNGVPSQPAGAGAGGALAGGAFSGGVGVGGALAGGALAAGATAQAAPGSGTAGSLGSLAEVASPASEQSGTATLTGASGTATLTGASGPATPAGVPADMAAPEAGADEPVIAGAATQQASAQAAIPPSVLLIPPGVSDSTTGVAGVGTSTTAPADTAATATPSFAQQLGARLTNLTGLGPGRHVLSVPIDPEHLGPVRVVARIAGDQVRIELVGATDQVREALRESLGQLRRDLADAGMRAELGLGTQSGDGSQDAPESSGTEPGPPAPVAPAAASGITTTQRDLSAATAAAAHTGRIDILV